MTDLVTGATGNVGNAIVAELLASGRTVRALVRSIERARTLLPPGVELVEGDITDPDAVHKAVAGVSTVFHAAGLPEQWQRDTSIFDRVNVGGTRNMISAALSEDVESFVYTSTIDVFVWPDGGGIFDETHIDEKPKETFYERSKQAADRLVTDAAAGGLPARFIHPAGVYGPAPVITPGVNRVIAGLATNAIPTLLPGGLPAVHSTDCALLHLAAEKAPVGSRYIASERYLTLTEIAQTVHNNWPSAKVPRVMPAFFARGLAEVGELVAKATKKAPLISRGELSFLRHEVRPDSGRAQRELDWRPRPFEQGVAQTLEAMETAGQLGNG